MSQAVTTEVSAVAADLVAAFGRHDPVAYFDYFDPDATFVFYTHPQMLSSRREWQELWAQWENESGFRVHSCSSVDGVVQVVSEGVAVFRHVVHTTLEMEGVTESVTERETIVFAKKDGRWLAVHEHLSPLEGGDD